MDNSNFHKKIIAICSLWAWTTVISNPAYCRPLSGVEVKLPPQSPNPWTFLMVYCQTVRGMHRKLADLCRLSPYYVDPSKAQSAVTVDATTEKGDSVIRTQMPERSPDGVTLDNINHATMTTLFEGVVVTDAVTEDYFDASTRVPNGSVEAKVPSSEDVMPLNHNVADETTPVGIIAEYDDSSSLFSTIATTDVATLSHNTTTKPIWTCEKVEYDELTFQCFTDIPTDVVVSHHNTTTGSVYTPENEHLEIISGTYPEPSCLAVEAMMTNHTYDYENYG